MKLNIKFVSKIPKQATDSQIIFFKDQNSKIPLVRNLKVLELYNSSISEFDSKLVFGNIKQSQLINKWNDNFTGGLEVYIEKNDSKRRKCLQTKFFSLESRKSQRNNFICQDH